MMSLSLSSTRIDTFETAGEFVAAGESGVDAGAWATIATVET